MENEAIKQINYSWHIPYEVVLGETYATFFNGLKEKKILGNVCPKCKEIYIPASPFCLECMEVNTEWVERDGMATLESYAVTYAQFKGLPEPPHITGIVKVGNAATNFLHFISGISYDDPRDLEKKLTVGMKLKPVWKEERIGDMFDIAYFEPA